MRSWTLIAPIVGTCLAAAIPLATYVDKQRHEGRAIATLGQIHQAQEQFTALFGGYATDLSDLMRGCNDGGGALEPETLDDLAGAGYVVVLRAARGAPLVGGHCNGRPLASDYYVSAAPRTAWEAAQMAIAGRAGGQLFVFVDGVPPRESDMAAGLATPVDELDSFRIP